MTKDYLRGYFMYPHACYFPTLTIFIDDKQEFLDSLLFRLRSPLHYYKFFSNPQEAISYIKNNYQKANWFFNHISSLEEEKSQQKLIEINLGNLHKQVNNQERFDVITSVLIDYDMPECNGLDVAMELNGLNLKRILLTGAADEKLAVNAFNMNLIDGFISKSSDSIYQEIEQKINESENFYFSEISKNMLPSYFFMKDRLINSIPEFITIFSNFIEKLEIVEFYILESDLSYLCLNKEGKFFIFCVLSSDYLEEGYQLGLEARLNDALASELKNKQKMLYFYRSAQDITSENIHYYLFNATQLILTDVTYYYGYKEINYTNGNGILGF